MPTVARTLLYEERWGEMGPDRISVIASSGQMIAAGCGTPDGLRRRGDHGEGRLSAGDLDDGVGYCIGALVREHVAGVGDQAELCGWQLAGNCS